MSEVFKELSEKAELKRSRLLYISAFVCSFIFYMFMVELSPYKRDFIPGRIATAVVSSIALLASFLTQKKIAALLFNCIMLSYVFLYLYLLHINQWSVFHRWSYFVVGAIFCSCVISWENYLFTAAVSFLAPVISGFYSPLSAFELIHFHAANFTVFLVIGISVKSVFTYKKEVINLTRSLVQTSKMAALGEMAGGIAHEINSPLAIIIGSIDLVKAKLSGDKYDDGKVNQLLGKIEATSFRIARIIQGLLNFSREASQDVFEVTDIREIISESLNLCSEKFKSNHILLTADHPLIPIRIACQKIRITQILINLLNNAFDACHDVKNPEVKISASSDENYAYISVIDNGPGVPPELESKIMQPFFTTKPVGSGTGLGLSISLGIANAHKGFLYLDRNVSASCFVLKLPLAAD